MFDFLDTFPKIYGCAYEKQADKSYDVYLLMQKLKSTMKQQDSLDYFKSLKPTLND